MKRRFECTYGSYNNDSNYFLQNPGGEGPGPGRGGASDYHIYMYIPKHRTYPILYARAPLGLSSSIGDTINLVTRDGRPKH